MFIKKTILVGFLVFLIPLVVADMVTTGGSWDGFYTTVSNESLMQTLNCTHYQCETFKCSKVEVVLSNGLLTNLSLFVYELNKTNEINTSPLINISGNYILGRHTYTFSNYFNVTNRSIYGLVIQGNNGTFEWARTAGGHLFPQGYAYNSSTLNYWQEINVDFVFSFLSNDSVGAGSLGSGGIIVIESPETFSITNVGNYVTDFLHDWNPETYDSLKEAVVRFLESENLSQMWVNFGMMLKLLLLYIFKQPAILVSY